MKFFKVMSAVVLGAVSLMLWVIVVGGFLTWGSGDFDGGDYALFGALIVAAAASTAGAILLVSNALKPRREIHPPNQTYL